MHDVRRRPGIATRVLDGPCTGPIVGLVCAAATVAGLVFALGPGGRSFDGLLHDNVVNNVVNGTTLGLLGAVLTRLRPANRVGWLVLAIARCNGLAILGEGWALASYQLTLPGRTVAAWAGVRPAGARPLEHRDLSLADHQRRDRKDPCRAHPRQAGPGDRVQVVIYAYESGVVTPRS